MFAPVAKIVSIRLLCALAAPLDWEIYVIDINSAFLNSEMPEGHIIFVKQPPGFEIVGLEHLVWWLVNALYGLKQSGRLWYLKLRSILLELEFHVSKADPCIFICIRPTGIFIIASHVDDLGLYVSCIAELIKLKEEIGQHVAFKDQGDLGH